MTRSLCTWLDGSQTERQIWLPAPAPLSALKKLLSALDTEPLDDSLGPGVWLHVLGAVVTADVGALVGEDVGDALGDALLDGDVLGELDGDGDAVGNAVPVYSAK